MVLDGTLVAACDKNHVADSRRICFFDRVLDQRFIDHREHFLGLRFGGGEESSAKARDGKDSFVNLCDFIHRLVKHLALKFARIEAGHFDYPAKPQQVL